MVKHKILIVEDDPAVLDVLRLILNNKDWQIFTAKNGREALDIYRFAKPDVVLMDIELPVMDGVEATKAIMSVDSKAIVIGITAFSRTRGEELITAGAVELIEKPFTKRKIISAIEKYLSP